MMKGGNCVSAVATTAYQNTKTGAGNTVTSYGMMKCAMPNTIKIIPWGIPPPLQLFSYRKPC